MAKPNILILHTDPEWRAEAAQIWTDMGGSAQIIQDLFRKADAQSHS